MHAAHKRTYVQNTGNFSEDGSSDLTKLPDATAHLVNAGPTEPSGGANVGEAIDVTSNNIEDYDNVRLAFKDGDFLDQSPIIPVDDLEVSDLTYSRPAQQVSTLTFPSTPSSDEFWSVKITNLESGNQPFERRSFEVEVLSTWTNSEIVEAFIDDINEAEDQINDFDGASVYAGVTYGTNANAELSSPSSDDDFNLTIESTTYTTAVVGGDERQTFINFVNEHEDDTLRNHGVTFEVDSNDDLVIFQTEGYDLTLTDGGDLDATISGSNGTSVNLVDASGTESLRLTANDVGDIFDVATSGFQESSLTQDVNPTDGVGTPEQLERYEQDDDGTLGRYVQSTNLLGSLPGPATYTQSDGQYDLLTFTFPGESDEVVNKSIARQTYLVALESAVINNSTSFDSFLSSVTVASDR